jgi:hypothetical protein
MLTAQAIPHSRHDLRTRWQHPQERRAATVDNGVVIHENFELSVPTVDHIHVGVKLTSKARRHTGCVQAGYSIRAVVDRDACHDRSDSRLRDGGPGVYGLSCKAATPRCTGSRKSASAPAPDAATFLHPGLADGVILAARRSPATKPRESRSRSRRRLTCGERRRFSGRDAHDRRNNHEGFQRAGRGTRGRAQHLNLPPNSEAAADPAIKSDITDHPAGVESEL